MTEPDKFIELFKTPKSALPQVPHIKLEYGTKVPKRIVTELRIEKDIKSDGKKSPIDEGSESGSAG